jgi:hypothetical protein
MAHYVALDNVSGIDGIVRLYADAWASQPIAGRHVLVHIQT